MVDFCEEHFDFTLSAEKLSPAHDCLLTEQTLIGEEKFEIVFGWKEIWII
jgi:hypothetical protein